MSRRKSSRKKTLDKPNSKLTLVTDKREKIEAEKAIETAQKEETKPVAPPVDKRTFYSKFGRFIDRHSGKLFWGCAIVIVLKCCDYIVEKDERQKKVDNICNRDIKYLTIEMEVKRGQAWLAAYRDSVYKVNFPKGK